MAAFESGKVTEMETMLETFPFLRADKLNENTAGPLIALSELRFTLADVYMLMGKWRNLVIGKWRDFTLAPNCKLSIENDEPSP